MPALGAFGEGIRGSGSSGRLLQLVGKPPRRRANVSRLGNASVAQRGPTTKADNVAPRPRPPPPNLLYSISPSPRLSLHSPLHLLCSSSSLRRGCIL